MNNYILNAAGDPVIEPSWRAWVKWMNDADRQVARVTIGESTVSTFFLGSDHNWEDWGPPVLWETRVFGGPLDQEQERCSGTAVDARAMHDRMVARVTGWKLPAPAPVAVRHNLKPPGTRALLQ